MPAPQLLLDLLGQKGVGPQVEFLRLRRLRRLRDLLGQHRFEIAGDRHVAVEQFAQHLGGGRGLLVVEIPQVPASVRRAFQQPDVREPLELAAHGVAIEAGVIGDLVGGGRDALVLVDHVGELGVEAVIADVHEPVAPRPQHHREADQAELQIVAEVFRQGREVGEAQLRHREGDEIGAARIAARHAKILSSKIPGERRRRGSRRSRSRRALARPTRWSGRCPLS
ncbi:hypothetical protein [Rhodosalinus sediminis]|uniref:hypothetical protein n=1 Tax=Rhodosalinus sediminis TaxID=1940533 RepID=UPI002353B227|nr:hypothetical protein [Rhodosalinus sediminis]